LCFLCYEVASQSRFLGLAPIYMPIIMSPGKIQQVTPQQPVLCRWRYRSYGRHVFLTFLGIRRPMNDGQRSDFKVRYCTSQLGSSHVCVLTTPMGFRKALRRVAGSDPATDFRGGGIFSLLNLNYMAQKYPFIFDNLLHKRTGDRAATEYPFCAAGACSDIVQCTACCGVRTCVLGNMCALCPNRNEVTLCTTCPSALLRIEKRTWCWHAGINITFQLEQLLELRTPTGAASNSPPRSPAGTGFVHLLDVNSNAFQELYVASFVMLDKLWLERRASYMDFPLVLTKTMHIVRQALHRRPGSLRDVCAYMNLDLVTS
jgi:hypothetical protein